MATRRRGTALEHAVLDAGWAQLAEQGYASFTFEAVAERARTGKAVLYRRWPDKEALLLAVLRQQAFVDAPGEIADTGWLREDVLALLRSANRHGDTAAAVFSTILGAYFDELEITPADLRVRLLGTRGRAMSIIVERALARGELTAPLPPRVVDLPLDLLRHEMIMNLSRVPDESIVDIVDTAFLPLATAPRGSAAPHRE